MFGRTVNTAARVSDVTPPGELYLTEAAAALVSSVPVEPVGAVDLESIGSTIAAPGRAARGIDGGLTQVAATARDGRHADAPRADGPGRG